jgi:hypothetical protein
VVEQRNTTLFVDAGFDMVVDPFGSFVVHRGGKEDLLPSSVREASR